ncbi:MAG: EscU/YscU/HrcU family type III secretion system export apparatus switch protein, partial [Candidatus Gastranaerophilales bacterium]|nr:EscU/YscU/HrcU family type III secretion system export apparatus switch protein [Candidatus Gastranaerophilales bacterium]
IFSILLPFFSLLFVAVAFVIGIQMKGLFSLKILKPKLERYAPSKLLKNLVEKFNVFKPKTFVTLVKSMIILTVISVFAWTVIEKRKEEILALFGVKVDTFFVKLGSIIMEIVINICIALLIIGILDWLYQKYEFNKSLKMTKQQVKDERKNAEGDPTIKSKIRSIQMQMANSRMMANVPTADVVVANPTHYAVALKYDTSVAPAPMVVAKGVDLIAFKIREVAENNGITVVENPPLARTLYKLVPIDAIIPAELFSAVAEVLAYVYKKKTGRG